MQDDVSELLRSATREYEQTKVWYERLKRFVVTVYLTCREGSWTHVT